MDECRARPCHAVPCLLCLPHCRHKATWRKEHVPACLPAYRCQRRRAAATPITVLDALPAIIAAQPRCLSQLSTPCLPSALRGRAAYHSRRRLSQLSSPGLPSSPRRRAAVHNQARHHLSQRVGRQRKVHAAAARRRLARVGQHRHADHAAARVQQRPAQGLGSDVCGGGVGWGWGGVWVGGRGQVKVEVAQGARLLSFSRRV